MGTVGSLQHRLPLLGHDFSLSIVQHGRCEQTDTAVVMVVVVPVVDEVSRSDKRFGKSYEHLQWSRTAWGIEVGT